TMEIDRETENEVDDGEYDQPGCERARKPERAKVTGTAMEGEFALAEIEQLRRMFREFAGEHREASAEPGSIGRHAAKGFPEVELFGGADLDGQCFGDLRAHARSGCAAAGYHQLGVFGLDLM